MVDLPFYLQGSGNNLISKDVINSFIKNNPELREYIDKHQLELKTLDMSYFESMTAWIISQHISGHVAGLILRRLQELCDPVTPEQILELQPLELKEIGLSKSKMEYLINLATFFENGGANIDLEVMSSQDIVKHFSQIKGIGPWTVNMFLIFNLGRLDVKAPNDLVVRKGMQKLYGLTRVPTVSEANKMMKSWGDLATIGTILSWAMMGE